MSRRNELTSSREWPHSRRATLCVAFLVALLAPPRAAWTQLADGCPAHTYLGDVPRGSDLPDWSEQAQGIANDGEHWFFTRDHRLFKYDANWRAVSGDDVGKLLGGGVGFPPAMVLRGIDHFGDPDHYGGYVFVPFEDNHEFVFPCNLCPRVPPFAIIGVFRASDLAFVDWVDVTDYQTKAGWLAIDPVERMLYTSVSTLEFGTPLLRYQLDMSKIENGIEGDFLTPAAPVAVIEAQGSPVLNGQFTYMQGGVFTPWGDLYLIAGKAGDSDTATRGGIHLFRRATDGTDAFYLVESSVNEDTAAGVPIFAYEYDPGSTGLGEEPEGIDWWNRDNAPDSRYPGQLHAILLDNQAGDDRIWLKHYGVDYHCMSDADSDGDGVSDRDEVYLHNTHPLLGDSDAVGVDDTADNCPLTPNAGQEDLDDDGLGDACDADRDGDGQSNGDEEACGSNPSDASSLAPDLDGDRVPDCVDADDDGDGQSDADEQACGSDPLDADSRSPDFDGDASPDCVDADDDDDGVADEDDRCPGTSIPEPLIPAGGTLGKNRYALLDDDLVFDRDPGAEGEAPAYTTTDTGGCSASQIAAALHLGRSHYESGIPRGILEAWIAGQR